MKKNNILIIFALCYMAPLWCMEPEVQQGLMQEWSVDLLIPIACNLVNQEQPKFDDIKNFALTCKRFNAVINSEQFVGLFIEFLATRYRKSKLFYALYINNAAAQNKAKRLVAESPDYKLFVVLQKVINYILEQKYFKQDTVSFEPNNRPTEDGLLLCIAVAPFEIFTPWGRIAFDSLDDSKNLADCIFSLQSLLKRITVQLECVYSKDPEEMQFIEFHEPLTEELVNNFKELFQGNNIQQAYQLLRSKQYLLMSGQDANALRGQERAIIKSGFLGDFNCEKVAYSIVEVDGQCLPNATFLDYSCNTVTAYRLDACIAKALWQTMAECYQQEHDVVEK